MGRQGLENNIPGVRHPLGPHLAQGDIQLAVFTQTLHIAGQFHADAGPGRQFVPVKEGGKAVVDDDLGAKVGELPDEQRYRVTFMQIGPPIVKAVVDTGIGKGTTLGVELHLHQVAPASLHPLGLETVRRKQILCQAPVEKCPRGANRLDRQQRELAGLDQRKTACGLQLSGHVLIQKHLHLLARLRLGRLPPGEVRQPLAGLQPDTALVNAGDLQGVQTTKSRLFSVFHVPLHGCRLYHYQITGLEHEGAFCLRA